MRCAQLFSSYAATFVAANRDLRNWWGWFKDRVLPALVIAVLLATPGWLIAKSCKSLHTIELETDVLEGGGTIQIKGTYDRNERALKQTRLPPGKKILQLDSPTSKPGSLTISVWQFGDGEGAGIDMQLTVRGSLGGKYFESSPERIFNNGLSKGLTTVVEVDLNTFRMTQQTIQK